MSMLKPLMMGRTALPLVGGTGYISVKWTITYILRKSHSVHTVDTIYQLIDRAPSGLFDSVSISQVSNSALVQDADYHT